MYSVVSVCVIHAQSIFVSKISEKLIYVFFPKFMRHCRLTCYPKMIGANYVQDDLLSGIPVSIIPSVLPQKCAAIHRAADKHLCGFSSSSHCTSKC